MLTVGDLREMMYWICGLMLFILFFGNRPLLLCSFELYLLGTRLRSRRNGIEKISWIAIKFILKKSIKLMAQKLMKELFGSYFEFGKLCT